MLKKRLIKERCLIKTKHAKIYKGVRIITITLLFLMVFGGLPFFADEHDNHGGHRRNWELIIGGGGAVSPKYSGSDEIEVKPLPFIDARFRIDSLALFLNTPEDGAGMAVTLSESFPITLSAGMFFGESNRENSDVDLLKGHPGS
jgi:outer membrane scaffolding protein for murein synthesis (MipA/OmpV family)